MNSYRVPIRTKEIISINPNVSFLKDFIERDQKLKKLTIYKDE